MNGRLSGVDVLAAALLAGAPPKVAAACLRVARDRLAGRKGSAGRAGAISLALIGLGSNETGYRRRGVVGGAERRRPLLTPIVTALIAAVPAAGPFQRPVSEEASLVA